MPEKVGYLMYKINTSFFNRLGGAELFGWLLLFVVVLSGFPLSARGLKEPDLKKPFKKCWDYGLKSGLFYVIASDNNSQMVISNSDSSLISIDPTTKLENWRSEIRGEILPTTVSDEDNLFLIADFKSNSDTAKTISLNSLSLKTGITKWQKKLPDNNHTEIRSVINQNLIFITTDDNRTLTAIQKANGDFQWKREFSDPITSVDGTSPTEIIILTENQLFKIKADTGEIIDDAKVPNNSAKNFVLKENYLLLGNSAGEIIKILPRENKGSVHWKIRTGGSISTLIELNEGVLATSLDNFMYLFSSESGKLKWKRRMSGRITRSPLIFNNYAVVVNSADSYASVINLGDGKVLNQIQIEDGNYFSGSPLIFGNFLILQTYRGIYFFSNTDVNCA